MPVTKTAKRALRGSKRKYEVNTLIRTGLEIALRKAKKAKTKEAISKVFSLADKAVKKRVIHKNKAARIKSSLSKLAVAKLPKKSTPKTKVKSKK